MQILNFNLFTPWKFQEIRGFLMPSSFIKNFVNHHVWLAEMSQNIAQSYQCKRKNRILKQFSSFAKSR